MFLESDMHLLIMLDNRLSDMWMAASNGGNAGLIWSNQALCNSPLAVEKRSYIVTYLVLGFLARSRASVFSHTSYHAPCVLVIPTPNGFGSSFAEYRHCVGCHAMIVHF